MIPSHLVFQLANLLDDALAFSNLRSQALLWIYLLGLHKVHMTSIVEFIDHTSDYDRPSSNHGFVSVEILNEMSGDLYCEPHENLKKSGDKSVAGDRFQGLTLFCLSGHTEDMEDRKPCNVQPQSDPEICIKHVIEHGQSRLVLFCTINSYCMDASATCLFPSPVSRLSDKPYSNGITTRTDIIPVLQRISTALNGCLPIPEAAFVMTCKRIQTVLLFSVGQNTTSLQQIAVRRYPFLLIFEQSQHPIQLVDVVEVNKF
jgi:hypothetical protein